MVSSSIDEATAAAEAEAGRNLTVDEASTSPSTCALTLRADADET
jgi:hypothetical protein